MRPTLPLLLCGLLLLAVASCVAFAGDPTTAAWLLGSGALGFAFQIGDAQLARVKALPNGANSVTTDAFDLGHSTSGDFLAQCEIVISAPALATGVLGNGATMTYIVEHSDDPDFGSAEAVVPRALVQTGADGAGAAAAEGRVRLPSTVKRYVRVKATNSAAGNASTKDFTAKLLF